MRWPVLLAVLTAGTAARAAPACDAAVRMLAAGMLPPSMMPARGGALATVSVRGRGVAHILSHAGLRPRATAGEIAYVDVGRDELRMLLALPGVSAVESTRRLEPTLDRSLAACGAAPLRTNPPGLDGRGALIGVVDTGIDFRHRDFRTSAGGTRVVALLDVGHARGTLHPDLPAYGLAALYTSEDIDAQLAADALGATPAVPVEEADTIGHGTHVAAIAASNGYATAPGFAPGRYAGVAPAADLAIANARRDQGFFEEDVIEAVRFVFDTAARRGQPAVVNLSLGIAGGPHDGSTNFETALAALAHADAAGRCLVVSAGNGGARDRHAGAFTIGGHAEVRVQFPGDAEPGDLLSIELFTDDGPPAVTLLAPDGSVFGPVAAGAMLDRGRAGSGRVRIAIADAAATEPGRRHASGLVVSAEGDPVAGGVWTMVLDGDGGPWDAWITTVVPRPDPRFLDHLDPDVRALAPAYAPPIISVGSVVNREGWTTADGRVVTRGTVPGAPSTFSGTGPSRDGRFLPDLTAPGDFVLAALASSASPSDPTSAFYAGGDSGYLIADDGVHGAVRGTSQAAPHVAGAIAILYQLDPSLAPRRLRELLRTSATIAAGAPGYSPRGGFGVLDVGRAVALLQRRASGPLDAARSTVGVSREAIPPGARATVTVVPRDGEGAPLGPGHAVAITASAGTFDGPVVPLSEGRFERTLIGDTRAGTAIRIDVAVDDHPLAAHPLVWVVRAREDAGRAPPGSCRSGGRDQSPGAAAILLVVLALVLVRRRR